MSKMEKEMLACPQCGVEQETEVWDSINVALNPELQEKLFKTEINVFSCSQCGSTALINSPLLYTDIEKKICVQFYPPELIEEDTFLEFFDEEGNLEMSVILENVERILDETGSNYLLKPHIVFDMDEMIRYINFRERIFLVGK